MRLFDRVGRLVQADAHGVMDQLEERSLLLKQHLREAEMELDRKRARLATLDEEERSLAESEERESDAIAALDADIELALAGGKEDLARFAVRRLLPRRATLAAIQGRRQQIAGDRERLAEKLGEQESVLADLVARVRAQVAARESREPVAFATQGAVADEEVELELLRRRGSSGGAGPDGEDAR